MEANLESLSPSFFHTIESHVINNQRKYKDKKNETMPFWGTVSLLFCNRKDGLVIFRTELADNFRCAPHF